jgi:hypothetical protein
MVVEELRIAGSNPGRWGVNSDVEDFPTGNGEGTISAARSVSAKNPPSIWGWRFKLEISSWICGDSMAFGVGVKLGWKIEAILRSKESKTLELYIKREARQSAENPQK